MQDQAIERQPAQAHSVLFLYVLACGHARSKKDDMDQTLCGPSSHSPDTSKELLGRTVVVSRVLTLVRGSSPANRPQRGSRRSTPVLSKRDQSDKRLIFSI